MAHAPCRRFLSQPASASWVWRLPGLACLVVAAPTESAFFTHRARTASCGSGPMCVWVVSGVGVARSPVCISLPRPSVQEVTAANGASASGDPPKGKHSGGRIVPLTMINLTPKLWQRSRRCPTRRPIARKAAQTVPPARRTKAAFGSRPLRPWQETRARSLRSGHVETERAASPVVGSPARFGVRGIHSQRTSAARRAPPENQAQLLCRMGPTVRSVTAPKCPVSEGSALAAPVSRGLPP